MFHNQDIRRMERLAKLINPRTPAAEIAGIAARLGADSAALIDLAAENHVTAPLSKNLISKGAASLLTEESRSQILGIPAATAAMNIVLMKAAGDILAAAADRGIDLLPLKGAALLGRAFSFDERQLTDIDFLCRREQLEQLNDTMTALGYEKSASCLPDEFAGDLSGELKYISSVAGATVEAEFQWEPVQGSAIGKAFPLTSEILWRFATVHEKRWSLAPEGEFLYHIFHFAIRHSFSRLQWLYDLDRMAEKSPPDWEKMPALLAETGLTRVAAHAFLAAGRLFGTEIPPALKRIVAEEKNAEIVNHAVLAALSGNTLIKQSGVIPILLSENKLSFFFEYLFPPAEFLKKRYPGMPVPAAAFFRPFDLASKLASKLRK